MPASSSFPAIYRGTVVDNVDPLNTGRLQVQVPSVAGTTSLWAVPCVPFASTSNGFLTLPPVGAEVWLQFEDGNENLPVWAGGVWAAATPSPSPSAGNVNLAANNISITSSAGGVLKISQQSGAVIHLDQNGIVLQFGGAKLSLSATGISLTNAGASILITPAVVNINNGALEVI
jgi:hypothetical protein